MFSMENLHNAWNILAAISKDIKSPLVSSSFQFALIEYAKPYKTSRGFIRSYKLDDQYIPTAYKKLHERILAARDQQHAHTDLTIKEGKVDVSNLDIGKSVQICKNNIYPTQEICNTNEIIKLIEETLDNMYLKQEKLEKNLPVNG